ncbi:MAG: outer membrane beta-barrel protein [Pseudohongiella sp.]|uniref:outer membrane beta-barrel protein n=1 Tax=Pseudohongiella sp. TaxID=1979412 RepID=UPI0034A0A071
MKNVTLRNSFSRTNKPLMMGLVALTLASSQVVAAAEPGWYAGASIGQTDADMDSSGIVAAQRADGYNHVRLENNDDDIGFKVYGGYQMNQYFALEGGYFSLGEFSYRTFMDNTAVFTADTKFRGVNIDLVGRLPLSEQLYAFGRIGGTRYESKDSYRGYGQVSVDPFADRSLDTSHKFGVGLQYDVNTNVALRLEAERYDINDRMLRHSDVDMVSFGVVYRFGQPVAAAPARAPVSVAPPQPAAAPAPAPAPTPAPVRVTLSADSLFGFDSATVTPAGRDELDKLVADLRGVDYDTIVVTGHTDRFGSRAHNLNLSERRAVAVKDYLVDSADIPAAKISTRGVNGDDPVTTMSQCSNQLARAQLIACLAPDRRVEVEVTGSRPR